MSLENCTPYNRALNLLGEVSRVVIINITIVIFPEDYDSELVILFMLNV